MTPPPYTPFRPAPSVVGGASVTNSLFPNDAAQGRLVSTIDCHPSRSSSASILTSWGIGAGSAPGTASLLVADAVIHQEFTTFSTIGNWASASVFGSLRLFLEEFTPAGAFNGGRVGGERVVVRESPFYIAGSDRFPPRTPMDFSLSATFSVRPGFGYALWVDMLAEASAAGMGGPPFFFGSNATVMFSVAVRDIGARFF